jgi:predicted Zn-dependent protease
MAPILARLATAKSPIDPTLYRQAAAFAVNLGALASAESLLARLERDDPEAGKLTADIQTQRHHLALPAAAHDEKAALSPAREVSYVAAFRAIARALDQDDVAKARAQLPAFTAAFPDTPGADVIACELDARAQSANTRAQAGKRCEAALAKYPGATRALALLALMAANDRHDAVAEKHLRCAIQLDPADPGPWRMLADLYRSTRARQRLSELESQHQALFSKPLPK